MKTQILNGDLLTSEGRWIKGGSVVINDHTIDNLYPHSRKFDGVDTYIDVHGGYILPGGIDLHIHGGNGHDFMDGTEEAFKTVIATHRRHGTTSLFPTLASCSLETMQKVATTCTDLMKDPSNGILGLHLEGPYFPSQMAGGQLGQYMRNPNPNEYIPFIESFPCVKRWDAAPEQPGALEFAQYITSKGIVAGIAHTTATYKEVSEGYKTGFTHATHFYNAMLGTHKRGIYKHEGTVESVYLIDDMTVEVIADGIHVPVPLLQLVHKIKGSERMCLVTDALACTQAPAEVAARCEPPVTIENGVCTLLDKSAIAGSVATMDRLIQTMVVKAGLPLSEVSKMVSATPARIMGVYDTKGSLSPHKDADIIILDPTYSLTHVFTRGIHEQC